MKLTKDYLLQLGFKILFESSPLYTKLGYLFKETVVEILFYPDDTIEIYLLQNNNKYKVINKITDYTVDEFNHFLKSQRLEFHETNIHQA